jgi:hypothetical protein
MSFYPTIDEKGASGTRALNGWLTDRVVRADAKRCKILNSLRLTVAPITVADMVSGDWYTFATVKVETKLPSFYRAWLYGKRRWRFMVLRNFHRRATTTTCEGCSSTEVVNAAWLTRCTALGKSAGYAQSLASENHSAG